MAYTTIDDPSAYFTTTLWTGSGTSSGRSITNSANAGNFQPDWLWIKPRTGTNATHHQLYDSSRGVSKSLRSSATAAEIASSAYGHVSAFDTNGFTSVAGSNNNENINENSSTFVAWQWKANGGTTTTNDASSTGVGNLDSVYQANTTAGFSIVTWTGTHPGNHYVAHGVGKALGCIIFKNRSDTANWQVRHGDTAAYHLNPLNDTDAVSQDNTLGHGMDSSTFALQNSNLDNGDGDSMVAYCFAPIQGYSKFGSYTGNGNNNGVFVYTGFKPAWILRKCTSHAEQWSLQDTTRSPFNDSSDSNLLIPSNSNAEATNTNLSIDILSNGFKCRSSDGAGNGNGRTYIYLAFAEHPFVSSKGVPITAR